VVSGYNVVYYVGDNNNIAPYYRVRVVNGGSDQTAYPGFISINWLATNPYTGSFDFLTAALTNLSKALLTRSVVAGVKPDGDFENQRLSGSDPGNTTTTPLGVSGTFTGTAFDATGFVSVAVIVKADQPSATDGLRIEFSNDGFVTTNRVQTFTYGAADVGSGRAYGVAASQGEEYRIKYINGTVAQTSFDLRTELAITQIQAQFAPIETPLTSASSATMTRSIVTGREPGGVYSNLPASGIDLTNSTTTALGVGATFTGSFIDVTGWPSIIVTIKADQASATSSVFFEFSNNGTTVHASFTRDYPTASISTGAAFTIPRLGRYFRVRYTNGSVAQTSFTLQTLLSIDITETARDVIEGTVTATNLASMQRSLVLAKNPAGIYSNVQQSTDGGLKSFVLSNKTAQVKQFTATTVAAQIDPTPLANRKGVTVKSSATGNVVIFVGFSGSLTTGNGYELGPDDSVDIDIDDTVPVWVVSASSTHGGSFIEVGGT
jgi:hypothetical protein